MAKRKRARASTADTDSSWVATNGQGASHYYQHRDSKNPRIQKHHHQHGGNDNGGGNGNGQLRPPEDLPRELHRFWYRRYQLFSRFDEGIRLSADMWFSVTPESIARVISSQIRMRYPGAHAVFDLFGGAGGNTIQFRHDFDKVLYLEINRENVSMAVNNYQVYWGDVCSSHGDNEEDERSQAGEETLAEVTMVEDDGDDSEKEGKEKSNDERETARRNEQEYKRNGGVEFYHGDFFKFQYPPPQCSATPPDTSSSTCAGASRFTRNDVVFLSPPWGGTSYANTAVWDLAKCQPYSIQEVVRRTRREFTDNIVLYLPRNSNLDEINRDRDLFPDLSSDEESDSDGSEDQCESRDSGSEDSSESESDNSSSSSSERDSSDGDSKPSPAPTRPKRPQVPALYLNEDGRCKALLLFLGPGLKPCKYDIYKN